MHLHYLTLQRQVKFLRSMVLQHTISESYTQRKNEWIIGLEQNGQGSGYLQLSCDAQFPYILFMEHNRRAKNSTDVMPHLIGRKIRDINLLPGERIVTIHFEDDLSELFLQFFTTRSNFFLLDKQSLIVDAFKSRKKFAGEPFQIPAHASQDLAELAPEAVLAALKAKSDLPLAKGLKQFQYMTGTAIQETLHRSGIPGEKIVAELTTEDAERLIQAATSLFQDAANGAARVYFQGEIPHKFSVGELQHLTGMTAETFDDINRGLRYFNFQALKFRGLIQKKTMFASLLRKKIKSLRYNLKRAGSRPADPEKAQYYQKIGQLVASQPQLLKPGVSTVELVDYYDPDMPTLKIDVNPELSASDNAEVYFKKARRFEEKAGAHKEQKAHLEKQISAFSSLLEELESLQQIKQLEKIETQLKAQHLLQQGPRDVGEFRLPYKKHDFKGAEIWVGRSARDNDEMTFKHANKNDFWLHVQGNSGSHVVLRNPKRAEYPPQHALEHAARLAVTNSPAKHASYVPVMYTLVKYVRKPRKSAPGSVIPSQTKTIFVDPL